MNITTKTLKVGPPLTSYTASLLHYIFRSFDVDTSNELCIQLSNLPAKEACTFEPPHTQVAYWVSTCAMYNVSITSGSSNVLLHESSHLVQAFPGLLGLLSGRDAFSKAL